MEQKFNIGDRVCYVEYIMKVHNPIDEVVDIIEYYGNIIDICGLNSNIGVPQALVAFDNYGTKYMHFDALRKIEHGAK